MKTSAEVRAAILLEALRRGAKDAKFWTCCEITDAFDRAGFPDEARGLTRDYARLFMPEDASPNAPYGFWLNGHDWRENWALTHDQAAEVKHEWRLTALAFAAAMAAMGDL